MPFRSELVGREIGPVRWEATPRRLLAFAAALAPGDAAPLDDAAPGGLTALPTVIVSAEWALSLMSRHASGQTLSAGELARGVHAGQDSRFLAPIRAGEVLVSTSRLTSARATRAGAAAASLITHVRESDGVTVAVTRSVSIFRGVELAGSSRDIGETPSEPAAPTDWSGAVRGPIAFERGFPHIYSECADIWNPIHTERAVALAAGLPDIIVHGTALWAAAGLRLARPARPLARLTGRFRAPVIPGGAVELARLDCEGGAFYRLSLPDGRLAVEGFAEFAA